jgi:uncharacterized lipoprotein
MMRKILILMAVVMLAGCATEEDTVAITYAPTSAGRIANAQPVALTIVDGRTADRNRISTKINAYGMEMAAIRSSQDVSEVVRQAALKEFGQRGFDIEASGLSVTLTVTRFYNQYSTGFFAGDAAGTVDLTVAVADKAGGKIYANSYSGVSKLAATMANGSTAAQSVAIALNDAFHKMFGDDAFIAVLTKAKAGAAPSS